METWSLWRNLTGVFVVLLCSFWRAQGQVTLVPFQAPVNIREDTTVETPLVMVDCSNPTDVCICNLIYTTPGSVPFNVWKKGSFLGVFYVYYVGVANGGPLNYQKQPSYFLTIECTNSTRQDNKQIVLEVDVLQNLPPEFTKTRVSVSVDVITAIAGDNVYSAAATDAENDPITYSIKSVSPPVNFFGINSHTGDITLTSDLFTATDSQIEITVEASDGFNPVSNFQLDVTLLNLNHRPEIRNLPQTIRLPENTPAGYTVLNLDIYDPDPQLSQLPVTCIVVPHSEQFRFKYDQASRKLTLATSIDFEKTSQYIISCEVSDGYLTSQTGVLNLIVENVNEPPEFDEIAYHCNMDESDVGISSCNIAAVITDPEGDKIPVVSFLPGNNSDRFRYDMSTSQITFTKKYDVDQLNYPTNVVLQLQAEDIHGETNKVPVYFKIRDVNDNKCDFGVTTTHSYPADQGTQPQTLGNLRATDADLTSPNNLVTYEIVSALPPEASNYITMYSDGTIAYIGMIPPQNHGKSYTLTVRCIDGGSPQLWSEATIVLTYLTTTTLTTPTTTTTTPTTTTPTTTTTEEFDLWEDEAFVGVFATMMALLALALLAAACLLCQACCGTWALCPAGLGACGPGGGGGGGGGACKDFCCPKPKPNKVDPDDNYFNTEVRTNSSYRDSHWKAGDHFESGTGYNPEGNLPGNPLADGPVRSAAPTHTAWHI